jgi:hypothetical protein
VTRTLATIRRPVRTFHVKHPTDRSRRHGTHGQGSFQARALEAPVRQIAENAGPPDPNRFYRARPTSDSTGPNSAGCFGTLTQKTVKQSTGKRQVQDPHAISRPFACSVSRGTSGVAIPRSREPASTDGWRSGPRTKAARSCSSSIEAALRASARAVRARTFTCRPRPRTRGRPGIKTKLPVRAASRFIGTEQAVSRAIRSTSQWGRTAERP